GVQRERQGRLPILQRQAGSDRGDEVVGFVRGEEDVVVVLLAHRQARREDEWGCRNGTRGSQENGGRHPPPSRERPAAAAGTGAHAAASYHRPRHPAWTSTRRYLGLTRTATRRHRPSPPPPGARAAPRRWAQS